MSLPIARGLGERRLSAELGHAGADLLIAATALARGLTVVTQNIGHFEPTGVPVLDPSGWRLLFPLARPALLLWSRRQR